MKPLRLLVTREGRFHLPPLYCPARTRNALQFVATPKSFRQAIYILVRLWNAPALGPDRGVLLKIAQALLLVLRIRKLFNLITSTFRDLFAVVIWCAFGQSQEQHRHYQQLVFLDGGPPKPDPMDCCWPALNTVKYSSECR